MSDRELQLLHMTLQSHDEELLLPLTEVHLEREDVKACLQGLVNPVVFFASEYSHLEHVRFDALVTIGLALRETLDAWTRGDDFQDHIGALLRMVRLTRQAESTFEIVVACQARVVSIGTADHQKVSPITSSPTACQAVLLLFLRYYQNKALRVWELRPERSHSLYRIIEQALALDRSIAEETFASEDEYSVGMALVAVDNIRRLLLRHVDASA
ncbi:g1024 [Coccomyxa elongata]